MGTYSRVMEVFLRSFARNPDGSWTCLAPATVLHPRGRIQVTQGTCFFPGTSFMDIDLAAWLEAQFGQKKT